MSEPEKRERPLTNKELREREKPFELADSPCWDKWQNPGIVRFQVSDSQLMYSIGVPFSSISSVVCAEKEDGTFQLGIEWKDNKEIQNIFITGPKVPDLYAQMCIHIVCVVKADGKDITRVALLPPKVKEE